mmetsp:Transcript_40665/g.88879  ORF Transcript_40665/g.88879 Transcript_40665/m.88879 type:complete len:213 (+) Transcript_40665:402-1040(+)
MLPDSPSRSGSRLRPSVSLCAPGAAKTEAAANPGALIAGAAVAVPAQVPAKQVERHPDGAAGRRSQLKRGGLLRPGQLRSLPPLRRRRLTPLPGPVQEAPRGRQTGRRRAMTPRISLVSVVHLAKLVAGRRLLRLVPGGLQALQDKAPVRMTRCPPVRASRRRRHMRARPCHRRTAVSPRRRRSQMRGLSALARPRRLPRMAAQLSPKTRPP